MAGRPFESGLGALGIRNTGPFGNGWVLYGRDKPAFIVARPGNGEAPASNGVTIGFAAATTAEVDTFHAAGLSAGGTDEGAPGLRPDYHPNYYGAYFRDPDGNKIGLACHRPESDPRRPQPD